MTSAACPHPIHSGAIFSVLVSHRSHNTEPGLVLTLGQGDVGQLGLGESVLERKKPALVPLLQDVVQAEAGGMHTVCLSQSGQVGQGWGRLDGAWARGCGTESGYRSRQ